MDTTVRCDLAPGLRRMSTMAKDTMSFGSVQIDTVPVLVLPVATRDTASPSHALRPKSSVFFHLLPTAFSSTPLDLINTDRGSLQVPGAHCADFVF